MYEGILDSESIAKLTMVKLMGNTCTQVPFIKTSVNLRLMDELTTCHLFIVKGENGEVWHIVCKVLWNQKCTYEKNRKKC